MKKGGLKNLAKFTVKILCWVFFFIIKKKLKHKCFLANLLKLQEHLFYKNTSGGCF